MKIRWNKWNKMRAKKRQNTEERKSCYLLRKKIEIMKREIIEKEQILGLMKAPSLEELEQEFSLNVKIPHDDEVDKWYANTDIEKHFNIEEEEMN